jgi:hypothetical protein
MAAPDDDVRYQHRFEGRDGLGRAKPLRLGAENGEVMIDGPEHWRPPAGMSDLLFGRKLAAAVMATFELAEKQRGQ